MQDERIKLTLNLDPDLERRLKTVADFKGLSVRGYCQTIIEKELTKDEANGRSGISSGKADHEMFAELRMDIFKGKRLPGDSAEFIREARRIRDAEIEDCA
jgi:hypothetical protein